MKAVSKKQNSNLSSWKKKLFLGGLTLLFLAVGSFFASQSTTWQFGLKSQNCDLPEMPSGESRRVIEVLDGDTFVIEGGYPVRVLGIDADERGDPCYLESKKQLEELVLNKEVVLKKGEENHDRYCRYLRWPFLSGENISLKMVEEGFATSLFFNEKKEHQEEIKRAERSARLSSTGCMWQEVKEENTFEERGGDFIWNDLTPQKTGLKVFGACETRDKVGESLIIEGWVVDAYRDRETNTVFLNFKEAFPNQCFSAVIFNSELYKFVEDPHEFYLEEFVRIKGEVEKYEGRAQIVLSDPLQIEVGRRKVRGEVDLTDEELKERIGQMIMVGFRGTEIEEDSKIVQAIREVKIGGVFLFDVDTVTQSFPRNIKNPEQLKNLNRDLQKYSQTPLFIAVDGEGGKVHRLKEEYGFKGFPSAEELSLMTKTEREKEIKALAEELEGLGVNMNLAPVLDLNLSPDNPVIGALGRSFSSDSEVVTKIGREIISLHEEKGVVAVAKHFPGHGSSESDSHLGKVDISDTYQKEELLPYKNLISSNFLSAVMTAHVVDKNIDSRYPATLSEKFLQSLLREELGFKGVIISDDLQMGAVKNEYGLKERVVESVNAGCDVLSFSNNVDQYDPEIAWKVRDIIYEAVKDGEIPQERVLESSEKIYTLKQIFDIIR